MGGLLVAAQACESVAVIDAVAEGQLGGLETLEEEADLFFVGHADAAVHLDRFTADQVRDVRTTRLRAARALGNVIAPVVDRTQCVVHDRAGKLELAEHLRERGDAVPGTFRS